MSNLQNIADEMKRQLSNVESGWVQRALFGGLVIVLERKQDTWRLALGRVGKVPSNTELSVCQRSFSLPQNIEWSRTRRKRRQVYQIAECVWIENGE